MSFESIIRFSIRNKLIIGLFVVGLVGWGVYALSKLPIDAVPDITSNQVVVLTQSPALAAQEVEQYITTPIELSLGNVQGVTEIRSVSRLGLSVITVVFDDQLDILKARQLVGEQISQAAQDIPTEFGVPYLAPITTGLGEIYQYTLVPQPGYETRYDLTELRSMQDWIVKRQLTGIPGVVEVSSFGGFVKQYEVSIDPERLRAAGLTIGEVFEAVQSNNGNTGGSYLEKDKQAYFIRGEGTVKTLEDIENIAVKNENGVPVLIRSLATVRFGAAVRYGAMTRNGESEAVGAVVLMLKGADAERTVKAVKERVARIQKSLPEGVRIEPFIDRTQLIDRAIRTVRNNLLEGGLIVVFVLVLLLGNWRAGLIVASVIPLAMLFTFAMMKLFGVSANLMSLGAIDFGLVVDGSVIVVEAVLHFLHGNWQTGDRLTQKQMDETVFSQASRILKSAVFGQVIILIVYIPILSLSGIEGKMFQPMALAVSFAIVGALILSLTYVPVASALFLKKKINNKENFSDRLVKKLYSFYEPVIKRALKAQRLVIGLALVMLLVSGWLFGTLGGEFIPQLDEGDIAIDFRMPTGTSLTETIEASLKAERALLKNFPEIRQVVGRIGASEIPTDPMPVEMTDQMINLKERADWTSADTREELSEKMNEVLQREVPGSMAEFTQPIQMRFNEMITGARSDVVVKIYGDDLNVLFEHATECAALIGPIAGVASCRVEPIVGLPQIKATYHRERLAQYGLDVAEINQLIRTSFAGETAGVVFEGERRFDLVVRMDSLHRTDLSDIRNLYIPLKDGGTIPLGQVADISYEEAPAQISRDNTKRRITIGINVLNRDVESVVNDIQSKLEKGVILPAGYYYSYGGAFENLQQAQQRLLIAVPLALLLIFALLYFTFGSLTEALIIFTAVPLSAIGGIWALWLRDMPFSISAGVGFIALFGVAVLNGIVLVSYFEQLEKEGKSSLYDRIMQGVQARFRPVLMTASVASLGFLPMALSRSAGAEVQRPLATVVIGGLITATLLTLVVLPVLYSVVKKFTNKKNKGGQSSQVVVALLISFFLSAPETQAQRVVSLSDAIEEATSQNLGIKARQLGVREQQALLPTAFDLPKTAVDFQYGQTQARPIDYTLTAVQSFSAPGVYKAQRELLEGGVQRAQYEVSIQTIQLANEVKRTYYQLLYDHNLLGLLRQQSEQFREAARAAEIRFQTGETNRLETVTAQSRYQHLSQRIRAVVREQDMHYAALRLLLQTDENVRIDTLIALKRPLPLALFPALVSETNPWLNILRQQVLTSQIQTRIEQRNKLPEWRVGLVNQSIEKKYGFSALQVGMSVPLFTKAFNARIEAARIQEQITETELRLSSRQLGTEMELVRARQQSLATTLDYYETYALPQADLIQSTALSAYSNGEVDYVAFFAALQQAYQLREEYLQQVLEFDQSLIRMEELAGEN
ncbi:CusA/CzcA family heavy metal efflux RND transporter [Arundinibacter roseus]|uniref:CusA/CzcA family heavy metal efflux RND transporter n=1 Tax=Arundinibacter roseus TaxID=2070510 RepID=A0A4R4K8G2_9BACT|nr:CusA/CzcA family heavy metal efflux RND transporter [Arundinibacter roseus]TDB63703.1 CusA/CzcA family heavy metal efflux RND transporter [Arundinibacter roseus]